MTWREDLRRVTIAGRILVGASFRGVSFCVDVSERQGGRRTVTHEFPLRDDPYLEDLGRRARTFRLDGYVVGDDYLTQKDALLAALEDQGGPGELVHPYYGVRRAICTSVSVHEARTEGGWAVFAIEFAEAPTQAPVPIEDSDPVGAVSDSATAAATASSDELAEQFNTALPSFTDASAVAALTKAVAAIGTELGRAISAISAVETAGTSIASAVSQELAQLTGDLALLTAEASSLVRTPATMLAKFSAAIAGLVNTVEVAPDAVMAAMLNAYGYDLGTAVVATTATRALELANQTALTSALRRAMAVQAARLAPLVTFTTVDDALAARDQIAALLDAQVALAGDTAYPALVDLRAQVMQAVPGSSTFSRVVTVTPKVPLPSIVLAYQLYGSTDLEGDIVDRNDIPHPGFCAGDLKVLSNG